MSRRKVLCIIDVYNWAMHNRFLALKKYFGDEYLVDVILFEKLQKDHFKNYDVVYCLNWVLHKHIAKYVPKDRKCKLVTTVCSHGGRDHPGALRDVFNNYDQVSASSMFLYKELKPEYGSKILYTPFGVDLDSFKKVTDPTKLNEEFGFVGKTNRPLKRFGSIQSASKDAGVNLKVVHHTSGLNRRQMRDFYNSIGTVVCFSENEGTPNPVLEGAACGRAIIAPGVGNVPQLFGSKYPLKMVTSESEMKQQMISLSKDKKLLKECSDYLYNEIKRNWDWKIQSEKFKELL